MSGGKDGKHMSFNSADGPGRSILLSSPFLSVLGGGQYLYRFMYKQTLRVIGEILKEPKSTSLEECLDELH